MMRRLDEMRRVSVTDQEESVAAWNASPAGVYIHYEPGESAPGRVIVPGHGRLEASEDGAVPRRDMASGRKSVINS